MTKTATTRRTAKAAKSTARKAQPKTAAKAQPAKKTTEPKQPVRRYADRSYADKIALRLEGAKQKGLTRPALMDLTGTNGSAVWRAQNGKIHPDEVTTFESVLDKIESGEIPAPERKERVPAGTSAPRITRAVLAERLRQVTVLLGEIRSVKKLTEARALAEQALTVVRDGTATPSLGEEVAGIVKANATEATEATE